MTDSRPWIADRHHPSSTSSSPPPNPPSSTVSGNDCAAGNVDRVLFKNLVEMVPLVESLMDKRANSSFTRRASMVYTPAPSQMKKIKLADKEAGLGKSTVGGQMFNKK
ncbi:hypothetical protein AXF42_Ash011943 [Apostasia shenzhenica]|uniref:Uncharacterized protein n=1 Tax=Apostasia shenzhenica TaxID=1088818 RepID=A0A2I0AW96_9ASPA|nr:hypothetical protein AXF42_Ash011943 [Apostasia shenzhenica]